MKKRIISVAIILIMCMGLFGGCTEWVEDYDWSEDSFSLEVVANVTEARIGDEVEITATFRNLSGKNLRIMVRDIDFDNPPDWRPSATTQRGNHQLLYVNFDFNRWAYNVRNDSLRKDETIIKTSVVEVQETVAIKCPIYDEFGFCYDCINYGVCNLVEFVRQEVSPILVFASFYIGRFRRWQGNMHPPSGSTSVSIAYHTKTTIIEGEIYG